MIFKANLDKEFEGMEECPICYYVIHSTTKELPKLSCKTCHYKFHSIIFTFLNLKAVVYISGFKVVIKVNVRCVKVNFYDKKSIINYNLYKSN